MVSTLSAIDKRFVRKLKEFAAHGYAFDSDHELHRGTQREAFGAYVKGFEEGHRHGYFEIPTGVGKTALFISIIKNYLDAAGDKKEAPRTLIVVPSTKLAVQTAQALAKFLPELAPTIETDDDKGKEIDWENSHIGLQYGKAKHAERKPRVLITTYQSLNRDREDKTYPPSEYGLVIYDEGHALTAAQYGLAVDKFKDSIQLAVSATPEYSEEKTVAERLPHRYYQLSIAEAVNRGDLCNVRPVLLKTNYTVNKSKFKAYVEKNQGRKLNDKQITDLLNQQVRNNAAMESYLLGSDPDNGERYLGQNGMIFCGSTDHVDDFTRQFDSLLNKSKYRPVRQWLKEEGVELIAPVHGKVKGAWLRKGMLTNGNGKTVTEGRKYQGQKEWYSEEEIFDLHAKGKILLLASVKKLKEGYDSPRDSIIIDTVDRLSKVDATQIDGRGFRLNPPNPEHNDLGNPDKTCTVINMVDKNTHELYADEPHMLPIYCAEVIEGAEFRKPARRKHLVKKFSKEPPDLSNNLEASNFKLITDIEVIREISRTNKAKRDKASSVGKPEGIWSSVDLSRAVGSQGSSVGQTIIEQILVLFKKTQKEKIDYLGVEIPKHDLVKYDARKGVSSYGIKEELGAKVAEAYKEKNKVPKGFWSCAEFAEHAGINTTHASAITQSIRKKFKKADSAEYLGVTIPKDAIVEYLFAAQPAFAISEDVGRRLATALKSKQEKLADVYSGKELGVALGQSGSVGVRIIGKLKDLAAEQPKATTLEYYGIKIPRTALVEYDSTAGKATGLTKSAFPLVKKAFEARKDKPDNVWSSIELARAIGINDTAGHGIIARLKRDFEEQDVKETELYGIKIPRTALITYEYKKKESTGILAEYGKRMAKAHKEQTEKPANVVSSRELGEKLGTQSAGEYIIGSIRNQLKDKSVREVTVRGVKIPRSAIIDYTYNGNPATGIKSEYAERIVEASNKFKTSDIWDNNDVAKAVGLTSISMMQSIKKQLSDPKQQVAVFRGVTIKRDEVVEYMAPNRQPLWGLTEKAAQRVIATYEGEGKLKAAPSLKPKPITPRKSPAHMTEEERAESKRSGRGKGD